MCHRDKSELKGTAALEYIRWGEAQGYHERPSCKGRPRWWDVGVREVAPLSASAKDPQRPSSGFIPEIWRTRLRRTIQAYIILPRFAG
jgi:hypothetical protein